MRHPFLSLIVVLSFFLESGEEVQGQNNKLFEQAYTEHPKIPKGLLESLAYNRTRINYLTHNEPESCLGLPRAYGYFGLIENGKEYFNNTLDLISHLSELPAEILISDPKQHIKGFAKAIELVAEGAYTAEGIAIRLQLLSELPRNTTGQRFALDIQTFEVLAKLNDQAFMNSLGYEPLNLDLQSVFKSNYELLSSSKIVISESGIFNESGIEYNASNNEIGPCFEYAANNYVQTPSCNFSSRAGTEVSAVTIHTIQGSYAGAISWAQNCIANVSYHYVVSNTGQVTQMLCETDKGWHVGSENPYTIGIEHDGYVTDPNNYTNEMYLATAALCKDITESGYGISPLRTAYFPWSATTHYNSTSTPGSCIKIKGHQHFPNQIHTDPGEYWDWDYFYKLMNPTTPISTITNPMGEFYDSGGEIGVYYSDDRSLTLIQPTDAESVSVTFQHFDLEDNWDYLYIYNGTDVFSPLIGVYTGLDNPGTVTSNEGHLLFEFRSDCAVAETGWEATFEGAYTAVGDNELSLENLKVYPNPTTGIVNLPIIPNLQWELYDATGRLISTGESDREIDLNIFQTQNQLLTLRLNVENKSVTVKVAYLQQ